MKKIFEWVKNNKLAAIIIVVLTLLLGVRSSYLSIGRNINSYTMSNAGYSTKSRVISETALDSVEMAAPMAVGGLSEAIVPDYDYDDNSYEVEERMVTKNSNISLLVKDATEVSKKIIEHATSIGGYMVSSRVTNPQDSATGYLVIDIPAQNFDSTLEYLESLSVKVVSQSLTGKDITDQYQDTTARLEVLRSNKARFEEIMQKAEDVDEILRVQRQIFSLQSQIDSLVGQQKALAEKAKYSRITISLSTDELSLPYMPDNKWRPAVIFKRALRSMLTTLQKVGNLAIWLVVYSPVILLIVIAYKAISGKCKLLKKKK